jgi:hypothetical protein
MPNPPLRWRHIIVNTKNTWLHGDERGFRDRKHRIHSTGDYKNPPPPGEHAGLHRYFSERAGDEVVLEQEVRPLIGRAMLELLRGEKHRVGCMAVGKVHAHYLVELPDDYPLVKRIAGDAKHYASRAVSDILPGAIWAAGGTYLRIKDREHLKNAYDYILYEQGPEAWTWSMRDGSDEGCFARKRPGA